MALIGKILRFIFGIEPLRINALKAVRQQDRSPQLTVSAPAPMRSEAEIVREVVMRSGLTKGRVRDVDFYLSALRAGRVGDEVRKVGTPLSADEKKSAGITFRGIVTHEFLSTLNDDGLKDVESAAWRIAGPVLHACTISRDLRKAAALDLSVQLRTSAMLAGPCAACLSLAGKPYPAASAPLLPLPDCSHPDQCACFYQSRLTDDGPF